MEGKKKIGEKKRGFFGYRFTTLLLHALSFALGRGSVVEEREERESLESR